LIHKLDPDFSVVLHFSVTPAGAEIS
jgi:hypothetical protein